MSAQELREAAARLRGMAEKATPAPWTLVWDSCDCGDGYGCSHGSWVHAIRFPVPIQEPMRPGGEVMEYHHQADTSEFPPETVEFIAAMHPGVGLALAKWLDDIAAGWVWDNEDDVRDPDGDPISLAGSMDSHPLALARLVNGGGA